jgi:threonine dehydrogenase-like Zn-dependent dehydrogenase
MGNIDLVYEAVGASRAAFEMMAVLGTNGIFIFTGVPGRKAPVEIDTDLLMRNLVLKNQVVFGSVNAGRDAFEAAIADLGGFAARWPGAVAGLITGRFTPASCEELLIGPARGIKNVIAFSEAA